MSERPHPPTRRALVVPDARTVRTELDTARDRLRRAVADHLLRAPPAGRADQPAGADRPNGIRQDAAGGDRGLPPAGPSSGRGTHRARPRPRRAPAPAGTAARRKPPSIAATPWSPSPTARSLPTRSRSGRRPAARARGPRRLRCPGERRRTPTLRSHRSVSDPRRRLAAHEHRDRSGTSLTCPMSRPATNSWVSWPNSRRRPARGRHDPVAGARRSPAHCTACSERAEASLRAQTDVEGAGTGLVAPDRRPHDSDERPSPNEGVSMADALVTYAVTDAHRPNHLDAPARRNALGRHARPTHRRVRARPR